jgi:hypothetical protein
MAAPKNMTPEQRIERARKAGQASIAPEVLANRLVKHWSEYTPEQQAKTWQELWKITQHKPTPAS